MENERKKRTVEMNRLKHLFFSFVVVAGLSLGVAAQRNDDKQKPPPKPPPPKVNPGGEKPPPRQNPPKKPSSEYSILIVDGRKFLA